MPIFATAAALAQAFEAGPATVTRWQKVVQRHLGALDVAAVIRALTSESHKAVAEGRA